MFDSEIQVLLYTAASIAALHTVIGVDHYLPFVVLGKAREWTTKKTLAVTALCGLGHVVGSIGLGLVGVGLGIAVSNLEFIEGTRGSLAAWGLISFGLVYAAYSFVRARRGHVHSHAHAHEDGSIHTHEHDHQDEHLHVHAGAEREAGDEREKGQEGDPQAGMALTKWSLFILFVLGPCEVLIPMFMVPAYDHNWGAVIAVAMVFGLVTIATMLAMVGLGLFGAKFVRLGGVAKHANVLAGLAIAISGLAIQVLGI